MNTVQQTGHFLPEILKQQMQERWPFDQESSQCRAAQPDRDEILAPHSSYFGPTC